MQDDQRREGVSVERTFFLVFLSLLESVVLLSLSVRESKRQKVKDRE